jgi:hypothetical protein
MGLHGKSRLIYIKDVPQFDQLISRLNQMLNYRDQNELQPAGSYVYLKVLTPEECDAQNRDRMENVDSSLGEIDFDQYQIEAEEWMVENQGDIFEFINFGQFKQILSEHGKSLENIHKWKLEMLLKQYKKDDDYEFSWENKKGTDILCPKCYKSFFVLHDEPLEDEENLQCPHCRELLQTEWINEPKLTVYRRNN